MKRLRPIDTLLLALVVPVWGAWFSFQVYAAFADRTTWVPVNVAAARSAADHPTVTWVSPYWLGSGGLVVGDVLIRAGEEELRGVGWIGFQARMLEAARESFRVPVAIERGGEQREIVLDIRSPWLPSLIGSLTLRRVWARVCAMFTGLACGITGIVILLKAPGAAAARPLFLALLLSVLVLTNLPVGPQVQTFALFTLAFIGSLTVPFYVRAAQLIPERAAWTGQRESSWPWLFYVPILLIWWSGVFGAPLSGQDVWQTIISVWVALAVCMLVVLTRNFRRSDPRGRRQIKWVVYGVYIVCVPRLLLALLEFMNLNTLLVYDVFSVSYAFLPICILIAVVRYNLFDIDRLISSTIAYSMLGTVLLGGIFAVVPAVAAALSSQIGLEPRAGQGILSIVFATGVMSTHRWLRPQIDRVFFADRYALERGVEGLLETLASPTTPKNLLIRAAETLNDLLRPETCAIYGREGAAFRAIFHHGPLTTTTFDVADPLIAALQRRASPLTAESWLAGRRSRDSGPFDRAALQTLGAAVIVPIHRAEALVAFLALGRKQSGDVYTATDTALLSSVANKLSAELLRFDPGSLATDEETAAHVPPAHPAQTATQYEARYDVFISYRRQGGSAEARAIRAALLRHGVPTFLDVDDLGAGVFEPALLRVIANVSTVVVVLTPGCLDGGDWLRQEVAHAIRTERNIVPILTAGFEFPTGSALPPELNILPGLQYLTYSHEYFDAMIAKLLDYIQKSASKLEPDSPRVAS